ncbi:alpha/beta hydrolase family protein [Brevundimonas sp.]|uniref:alpha/beta hydrolase family protein n=1 Tax=Brevundimonas sp. TaxID=1871086 RepID=UPI002FC91311
MILTSMIAVAALQAAAAPQLAGQWEGVLSVGGQSLRIVLRVDPTGAAVVDSPDQGANGIPADGPTLEGGVVRFSVPAVRASFEGALSADGGTITGALTQGPAAMPVVLTRTADVVSVAGPSRPQTPVAPFPYRSEDVTFPNAVAGITLAGTLTLPTGDGPFPAAILITGSGAQDRDETIFNHKPFLVWADALTRRGVAVLRYDDRGVGGSGGGAAADTTADFATDAAAAMAWLRTRPEIDARGIGLIGHSEGGLIAPMVAEGGGEPAWIVMLAGTSVNGGDILVEQQRRLATAAGLPAAQVETGNASQRALMDAVARNKDDAAAAERETVALLTAGGMAEAQAKQVVRPIVSAWYRWFVAHDPAPALAAVHVPLLALYGGKDLQVPADQNAPVLARVQPAAEIVILPDLNHLMQTAETGAPSEYGTIEETIAPEALKTVVDWVAARSGLPPQ